MVTHVPASQLINPAGTHSLLLGSAASRSMITHFHSPSTFTLIQFSHLRSLWVQDELTGFFGGPEREG
jgi:hypothetical protein